MTPVRLNKICAAAERMLKAGTDTRPILRDATSRQEPLKQQRRYDNLGYSPHQGARECARRRAAHNVTKHLLDLKI